MGMQHINKHTYGKIIPSYRPKWAIKLAIRNSEFVTLCSFKEQTFSGYVPTEDHITRLKITAIKKL